MSIVRIPLTQGQEAVVDEADWPLISQHHWWAKKSHNLDTFYAYAWIEGARTTMHRFLFGNACSGMHVDHKDGNGLNNRRNNIRLATNAQNARNRGKSNLKRIPSSQFKGVTALKGSTRNKWRARIIVNREFVTVGYFPDEESAARAYDAAALQHFGEFANLNFPPCA